MGIKLTFALVQNIIDYKIEVTMKALTLLGIILLSNLHVLTSDPSKSIDHLKKKSANPEVVKKHSAKTDTEHHEFKQKKEFHLENDESNRKDELGFARKDTKRCGSNNTFDFNHQFYFIRSKRF